MNIIIEFVCVWVVQSHAYFNYSVSYYRRFMLLYFIFALHACTHTQCEYFISEYEDEIILLFQDGLSQKKLEAELCHDITGEGVCL